jgi:hypothetical protein
MNSEVGKVKVKDRETGMRGNREQKTAEISARRNNNR